MVKLRKILFVIFVIVYLILCPTLILYSLGIVIKPGNKKVVKTGIIHISSVPAGASITLNGKLLDEQTPAALSNLLPGVYILEITAKKYHPWKKIVPVAAEKVTPIENVLLIPDPLNIKELSATPSEILIPAVGNPYLLVANGPTLADIFIYVWDEGIGQNLLAENENKAAASPLRPVVPADSPDRAAKLVRLHTAKNSPYILFEIENGKDKKLLWIDPLFGTPKVEEVTDLFPEAAQEIQWDANDPRHLLSLQDSSLNRMDLTIKAIYPKVLEDIAGFSLWGQEINFLTSDRDLRKSNQSGGNQSMVLDDPSFNDLVTQHFPYKRLSAVSDNLTLLLGRRGELIGTVKPYLLSDRDIEGFKWNERPSRLLVWSRHAVGLIDFPRRTEDLAQVPGVVRWIIEQGTNITDAFWVNDGSHILYVDDDKLFITDTASYGQTEIEPVTTVKHNSAVYYADKIGKVFFLNQDGRLSSGEIVPQKSLLHGIKFEPRKKEKDNAP
jgi:hypothetical protein